MGEIGHQHIQAPLAAAISPLAISPSTWKNDMRPDHNTGSSMPYSLKNSVWVLLHPTGLWTLKGCETGPTVYSSYIGEDLKVLTICGCNYKGSTFSSVILRPWVLVRPELNSRPAAWQPDAQPTEPLMCGKRKGVASRPSVPLFNFYPFRFYTSRLMR